MWWKKKSTGRAACAALKKKPVAQAALDAYEARRIKHLADQAAWLKAHFGYTQEEFEAQGFHIRHGGNFSYVGDFEIELPDGSWVELGCWLSEFGALIQAHPGLIRKEMT